MLMSCAAAASVAATSIAPTTAATVTRRTQRLIPDDVKLCCYGPTNSPSPVRGCRKGICPPRRLSPRGRALHHLAPAEDRRVARAQAAALAAALRQASAPGARRRACQDLLCRRDGEARPRVVAPSRRDSDRPGRQTAVRTEAVVAMRDLAGASAPPRARARGAAAAVGLVQAAAADCATARRQVQRADRRRGLAATAAQAPC